MKRTVLNVVATGSCDKDQSITSLPKVEDTKPADDEDHAPLSPIVVELNPQKNCQNQVVVQSNDDSEIYAQIDSTTASFNNEDNNTEQTYSNFNQLSFDHQVSLQRRAASVPYLPDLREHFIALNCKSKRDLVDQQLPKSRGTFSPGLGCNKKRSVTFSVTPVIFSNANGE